MLMMQLLQRKDTTQAADSVLAETGSPPIPAEANSGEVGSIPQMAPEMKNADLNQFRIWIYFYLNDLYLRRLEIWHQFFDIHPPKMEIVKGFQNS